MLPDKIVEFCQTPGEALKHFPDYPRADSAASSSRLTLTLTLRPACSDMEFGLMRSATPRKDCWVGVHILVAQHPRAIKHVPAFCRVIKLEDKSATNANAVLRAF